MAGQFDAPLGGGSPLGDWWRKRLDRNALTNQRTGNAAHTVAVDAFFGTAAATEYTDTGAGIATGEASGVAAVQVVSTGAGIATGEASGSAATNVTVTGAGELTGSPSGDAATVFVVTGVGIASGNPLGAGDPTVVVTGAGIASAVAAGVSEYQPAGAAPPAASYATARKHAAAHAAQGKRKPKVKKQRPKRGTAEFETAEYTIGRSVTLRPTGSGHAVHMPTGSQRRRMEEDLLLLELV